MLILEKPLTLLFNDYPNRFILTNNKHQQQVSPEHPVDHYWRISKLKGILLLKDKRLIKVSPEYPADHPMTHQKSLSWKLLGTVASFLKLGQRSRWSFRILLSKFKISQRYKISHFNKNVNCSHYVQNLHNYITLLEISPGGDAVIHEL